MTKIQQEYLRLHAEGFSITAIARKTGKAKSTISSTIKRAKMAIEAPQEKGRVVSRMCQYSQSCFTCPLIDCVIDSTAAPLVNVI